MHETEIAQFLCDGSGEFLRGGLPEFTEHATELFDFGGNLRDLGIKLHSAFAARFEKIQPFPGAHQHSQHLGDTATVLAFEPVDLREPVIQLPQPRRVGVNALREIGDSPVEFLHLYRERGCVVAPRLGIWNDAGEIAELFLRRSQRGESGRFGFRQYSMQRGGEFKDARGIGDTCVFDK